MLIAACVEKRSKFLIRNMVESPGHFVMTSVVINGTSVLDPRKWCLVFVSFVEKSSLQFHLEITGFAVVPVQINLMGKTTYERNLERYLLSISVFETMLKKGEIDQSSFEKVEQKVAEKYGVKNKSIFRSF